MSTTKTLLLNAKQNLRLHFKKHCFNNDVNLNFQKIAMTLSKHFIERASQLAHQHVATTKQEQKNRRKC